MEVNAAVFQLVSKPINCHSWSGDGKRLAVCPNDETVKIFKCDRDGWSLETTLSGHDQIITAMDWYSDQKGDRLLTVSADRNGYVWTRSALDGDWTRTLVLLRLRRAPICVRWSFDGRKFAVGGAEGLVSIGYYEAEDNWWICKHLKHLDGSAVLSISWHPNNLLLSVATLAGTVEVLCTVLKNVDIIKDWPEWVEKQALSFDDSAYSLEHGHWIHAMTFSPSGDQLALASHNGNICVIDFTCGKQVAIPIPETLPIRRVIFLSESTLAASDFGSSREEPGISIFIRDRLKGKWTLEGQLRAVVKDSTFATNTPSLLNTSKTFGGALAKFKALDLKGTLINEPSLDKKIFSSSTSKSTHQGGISELRIAPDGRLASTGYDGRLVLWEVSSLLSRTSLPAL